MVDDSADFSSIAGQRLDSVQQFVALGPIYLSTVLTPCSDRYHMRRVALGLPRAGMRTSSRGRHLKIRRLRFS